jgi:hypothetical protein
MFGQKRKVTAAEVVLAKKYYDEMEQVSKELVQSLNLMERRINVLSEEEISSL